MESIILFIVAILLILSAYIYFTMSDAFSVKCPKYKKIKKFIRKDKEEYIQEDFEEHIPKVNAFNKTNNDPMPAGSIIPCDSRVPKFDKRMNRSLDSVQEIMYHENRPQAYGTKPIFL